MSTNSDGVKSQGERHTPRRNQSSNPSRELASNLGKMILCSLNDGGGAGHANILALAWDRLVSEVLFACSDFVFLTRVASARRLSYFISKAVDYVPSGGHLRSLYGSPD